MYHVDGLVLSNQVTQKVLAHLLVCVLIALSHHQTYHLPRNCNYFILQCKLYLLIFSPFPFGEYINPNVKDNQTINCVILQQCSHLSFGRWLVFAVQLDYTQTMQKVRVCDLLVSTVSPPLGIHHMLIALVFVVDYFQFLFHINYSFTFFCSCSLW